MKNSLYLERMISALTDEAEDFVSNDSFGRVPVRQPTAICRQTMCGREEPVVEGQLLLTRGGMRVYTCSVCVSMRSLRLIAQAENERASRRQGTKSFVSTTDKE